MFRRACPVITGTRRAMTLEAHATAAGAGHPHDGAEPPPARSSTSPRRSSSRRRTSSSSTRRDGSVPVGEPHPLGVYRDDCRFLSGHELCVNGVRPRLLVASAAPGSESVHELTNPALPLPGGPRAAAAERSSCGSSGGVRRATRLEETLLVHSYDREPLDLDLDLLLAADFEPMLAIRGIVAVGAGRARRRRAARAAACASPSRGRDGLPPRHHRRRPTARASAATGRGSAAVRALARSPAASETIALRYELHEGDEPPPSASAGRAPARRARRAADAWLAERTVVETDDELFNRVLRRSLLDIRMLHSRRGADGYYAAGVPWYATLFGRDSLITATPAARLRPADGRADAAGAGRAARRRATTRSTTRSRARSMHELRVGRGRAARPVAARALLRHRRRDAAVPLPAVPSTPTGPATCRCSASCAAEVEAMLGWIDGPGRPRRRRAARLPQRAHERACATRAGRTPTRACSTSDGAPLEPPIALVEPQAYALPRQAPARAPVRARRRRGARAARCCAEADGAARAARALLAARARLLLDGLRRRRAPERGARLQPGPPAVGARAPAGRAPGGARRADVATRCSPAGGSGRSAEGEAGYNPVGYHLGTVWPHDTALIAFGLRKYGFDERLRADLRGAARGGRATREGYRLPELFAGLLADGVRDAGALPGRLPAAGLGGRRDPVPGHGRRSGWCPTGSQRRLRIRRPSLPRWLNRVEVRGLRIAGRDASTCCSSARAPAGRWRSPTRGSRATSRSCSRSPARATRSTAY